jgi:serralysin
MIIQWKQRFLASITAALAFASCASPSGPDILTYDEFRAKAQQEPDTGLYIINGDELVTSEQEMHAAYDAYVRDIAATASGYATVTQGLTINRVGKADGPDDKWSPDVAMNLTYCVSQSSLGSHYNQVVTAMNSATGAWEQAAHVDFSRAGSDANCTSSSTAVMFNVRLATLPDGVLARSFFPSNARNTRELLIGSPAFGDNSPITLAGILRHELGHILGFRHEHIRPEAGGLCTETNSSFAGNVTTYDSASVMHYPQCNGTNTGDLVLTSRDKAGARLVYPFSASDVLWRCVPQAPATACGQAVAGATAIWDNADAKQTSFPGAVDFGWQIKGVGDFDGNGVSDILWRSVNGDNAIWYDGNAPGAWIAAVDTSWNVAGIGDFDGDRRSDILWRDVNGNNVIWYGANAPGLWISAVDNSWRVAGIGDFDGNGMSDILWRSVNGDNVIWYEGNAPGLWITAVANSWQVAGIGDFDGDRRSDILWRDVNGNNVIWYAANAPGAWITALDTGWRVTGIADFDGDGLSDILWRRANGDNAIWHGGSAFWTSFLTPLDNNWQVAGAGFFR